MTMQFNIKFNENIMWLELWQHWLVLAISQQKDLRLLCILSCITPLPLHQLHLIDLAATDPPPQLKMNSPDLLGACSNFNSKGSCAS